ncbi:MAG TPA: GAF domain-containing sensor histidine kinase [Vicinamibacterales bacterium]|nr:GAF domain-containing sensor histidine kinase [Vicinamibacterales bacterium]
MDEVSEDPLVLRRCVRDLVALSTLPAVWAKSEPRAIAEELADVLRRMVPTELLFVRVADGKRRYEAAATTAGRCEAHACRELARALAPAMDPAWTPAPLQGLPGLAGSLSVCAVPIGFDATNGTVIAASLSSDFPSAIDRLLLRTAANAAAVVLERRQTEEHLRDDQRTVDTLHRIGASLVSELDRQRLLQMVTDEATALTGAEFGAFFFNVQEARGGSYMLYTLAGAPRETFANFPMPRATALFGPTFRGEGVVRIDDVRQDPRYGRNPPHHGTPPGHLPVRSYLAVPVKSRSGAVHGGLFFGHATPGVFTERDERLALGIAGWAALALDNAVLYHEAQTASRAKDDFLATVSHELRTPVNAVLGWVTMLSQGALEGDRARAAIAAIERNTRAQVALIEDLLDVSRFLGGSVRLELSDVNVREAVEGAVDAVQVVARSKGIEIRTALDADLPRLRADATRLRQIVWNLLSNAVKFSPPGGEVEVRACRETEAEVVITVSDTGDGIDPAFLPHVFDRFSQADPSTTREHSGLGLGLWIVRHLTELHGGRVWAASPGLGQGASFTVRLPVSGPSSAVP